MLKRIGTWDMALHEYVEARVGVPFKWGANDCALFVADGIKAMTGTDVAEDFRGKYADEAGAVETIGAVTGGKTVADAAAWVAQKHDMSELSTVLLAHRGDMVLFNGKLGPAMGLVYLNGTHAAFVGDEGLKTIPLKQCVRAWRVGF